MRKQGWRVVAAALIFVMAGTASTARADEGYYADNPELGQVFGENKAIRMVSEIVIYRDNWFTTAFVFSNVTEQQQTVKMGFPISAYYYPDDNGDELSMQWNVRYISTNTRSGLDRMRNLSSSWDYKVPSLTNYFRFSSTTNGAVLPRTFVINTRAYQTSPDERNRYDYIYVGTVNFQPHQTIIMTNRYYQEPDNVAQGNWDSWRAIKYVLRSGATWAGPIGDAKIAIYIPKNRELMRLEAGGAFVSRFYIETGNTSPIILQSGREYVLYWHYRDVKPDFDIEVKYGYPARNGFAPDCNLFNQFSGLTNAGILNTLLNQNLKLFLRCYADEDGQETYLEDIYYLARYNLTNQAFIMHESIPAWVQGSVHIIPYRFLINSIYACYGYKFSNSCWQTYFEKFVWYRPITDSITLRAEDQDLVNRLLAAERQWHTLYH